MNFARKEEEEEDEGELTTVQKMVIDSNCSTEKNGNWRLTLVVRETW